MRIIDLSVTIRHEDAKELERVRIKYINHRKGANLLGLASCFLPDEKFTRKLKNSFLYIFGLRKITYRDFPDTLGLAWERLSISTHCGTHLDAPYHYGPYCASSLALRIDNIPLDYCFSDGVLLDFRHKNESGLITAGDIKNELQRIGYRIKPKDIVLIMTGTDKKSNEGDYPFNYPSLDRQSIEWLVAAGVKIIGTDTWGMDRPVHLMARDFFRTKNKDTLWPIHCLGREKEYFQIEKLANLDQINRPFGFKIACFPIKIKDASAGWVRVVAIFAD
jgi:kynurenine formamidase